MASPSPNYGWLGAFLKWFGPVRLGMPGFKLDFTQLLGEAAQRGSKQNRTDGTQFNKESSHNPISNLGQTTPGCGAGGDS